MAFRSALVALVLVQGALGHGALTKPLPRKVSAFEWAPWSVGEHQASTNPYGEVHRDAKLSHPCGGSSPGDAPYSKSAYANYQEHAEPGEESYAAGGKLEATIVLDADHDGEAQWGYCPHSEEQTEECFRSHAITDWVSVHSYWDASNDVDHWKDGQTYPEEVTLPADMPTGPVTLRWLWICKYTDEIFVSCFDTKIGDGSPASAPAPGNTTVAPLEEPEQDVPEPSPTLAPAPATPSPQPQPAPEPAPAPAPTTAAPSQQPVPKPGATPAPGSASFCCTWSAVADDCGACESKSSGWCAESAANCEQCGSSSFHCPAASMTQKSFLSRVRRHALHGAQVLIQSESVLTRGRSASGLSGRVRDVEL